MERRFILVGCGGVGTHLAQGLVRMLEYKAPGNALILIDGDNFEPKNKERQLFKNVGNKAEALAMELSPDFPQTFVVPQAKWVVESVPEDYDVSQEEPEDDQPVASKIAARDLLSDWDVVYAVVDNDMARKVLIEAAGELPNVDVFLGGNDENLFGSVYHYRRRDGEDITVNPKVIHPQYDQPEDRNPGDLSCQERAEIEGGTQLIATNMAVAAFLLGRTQKVILNEEELTEAQVYFDLGLGKAEPYDRLVENTRELIS